MRAYDLIVIEAGSGNMLFGPELDGLGSAIIEPDRFGGTCLNRGCIPSKMFVVAADTARLVLEAKRLGVHAALQEIVFVFDTVAPDAEIHLRVASYTVP